MQRSVKQELWNICALATDPSHLGMEKIQGKVTNGQGISCEGAIAIMQGISIGGGKCIEMGGVNGSESDLKEWV